MPASETWLADNAMVIGVSVGGKHRAYCIRALAPIPLHVINDELATVPISVTFCDRTNCVKVFTDQSKGQSLPIGMGGYVGVEEAGALLLRIGNWHYRQDSLEPIESDAPKFPYSRANYELLTWKQWRDRYPETDVYAGEQLRGPPDADVINGLTDLVPLKNPPIAKAETSGLSGVEEVIGISSMGKDRAYLLKALTAVQSSVVNDELDHRPITVSYCERTGRVQVFAGNQGTPALDVAVGGQLGARETGDMLLRVGPWHYFHNTGLSLEREAPRFPYSRIPYARMTWQEWLSAHPGSDIYVGGRP